MSGLREHHRAAQPGAAGWQQLLGGRSGVGGSGAISALVRIWEVMGDHG